MRTLLLSDGIVDLDGCVVQRGGSSVGLTSIEQRLLAYLAERMGQVVGREELLVEVWGYRAGVRSRTIDNVVRRVREKIEPSPSDPAHLHVVYGHGLKLIAGSGPRGPGRALFPASRFVGRAEELALTRKCLAEGRAVTLVGPPGVGKSRLAEQVFDPSTAIVVPLGAASGLHDVLCALAAALGPVSADPHAIGRALDRRGRVLLVLDGCERLADDLGPLVRDWLDAAPELRVLATSRRPLDLPDEQRIPLGPLSEDDAVALFLDRVRRVAPAFGTHDGVPALVSAMDRLPLAIEVVAARARAASIPQLIRMLDRRLDLLSSDDRGIRATLDLSFGLLGPSQRSALHELAVFGGPFTLDAAEAVLGGWVLDRVQGLVDHSLVAVRHGEGGARYALYDIVRDRARELAPPKADTERRLALWLTGPERGDRPRAVSGRHELERAMASIPDLRASFERLAEVDPDLAAACALVLLEVYGEVGPYGAGLALVERLETIRCGDRLRIRILVCAADLWFALRSTRRALAAIERAIALAAEPATEIVLRLKRASLLTHVDTHEVGLELERAGAHLAVAPPRSRVVLERIAGELRFWQADLAGAEDAFRRSRDLALEAGEPTMLAGALGLLAMVARARGRWAEAEVLYRESLAIGASVGDRRTWAITRLALAGFERQRGRLEVALREFDEIARLHEDLGDRDGDLALDLELALLDCQRGGPAAAIARLLPYLAEVGDSRAPRVFGALGEAGWLAGDLAVAREAADRAMAGASSAGMRLVAAQIQATRALVVARTDLPLARTWIAEGVEVLGRAGARALLGKSLAKAAIVETRWGDPIAGRAIRARAEVIAGELSCGPESELGCWLTDSASSR